MMYDWCEAHSVHTALTVPDFDHIKEQKVADVKAGYIYIKTQPNYKICRGKAIP